MATPDGRRRIALPILAAVLGLAAIGVIEEIPVRHSVEQQLTTASTAALNNAGVPVDGVTFTGRDGTVRVETTAQGDRAYAIVSRVNGVRVVHVIVANVTPPTQPTPVVSLTAEPSAAPTASASGPAAEPSAGPSATAPAAAAPSASASAGPTPTPTPSASAAPPAPPAPTTTPLSQVQAQLSVLGDVTFTSGSTTLTSRDQKILAGVARVLAANPGITIRVQGNTDSVGSAAVNLAVSRQRAQIVAAALHALGVATDRMTIVAYGETKPLVPNDTPAHRAENRRVDFLAEE